MRMMEEHETVQARGGPLGAPTITPTLASGGHGPNIVPQNASVYIDYRITTATADDGSVSEDCQAVVDRLTQIAHEVLDDSEHCTGFEVENNNDDGLAGNPSFYQDPDAP
jgi:acetylornithine deacetylase/succinyl-diaminopimelate desuccinylase-like protein